MKRKKIVNIPTGLVSISGHITKLVAGVLILISLSAATILAGHNVDGLDTIPAVGNASGGAFHLISPVNENIQRLYLTGGQFSNSLRMYYRDQSGAIIDAGSTGREREGGGITTYI